MKNTLKCVLALAVAVPIAGCKKESKPEDGAKPAATAQQQQADLAALEKAAEKWVDQEFQPSTLTREQQLAELKWFREAAAPYRGQTINVV
ncbi:MAG TPA: carbohydrate ABC transporter substrate-binding protein, partial [Archangium sp.]|nr:carbohydrate ABC transporter substrate-binding protein [Archangium sp.]